MAGGRRGTRRGRGGDLRSSCVMLPHLQIVSTEGLPQSNFEGFFAHAIAHGD